MCYCAFVTKVPTKTRVVLLQHRREREVAINTARIAHLCLPESELHVGVSWEELPFAHDPARPPILLYPEPGARDLEREPPRGPVTLVVVDGTWWQARKVVRTSPALAALPRYAFRPPSPSDYRIRREPEAHFVSTIEAVVHVLRALEPEGDPARFDALLTPFRAMVDAQLSYRSRLSSPRERHPRPRLRREPRALAAFKATADRVVCVHAEANAWPYDARERAHAPDELVQWVACRVATGERFEAIVSPSNALCPATPRHTELSPAMLDAGESLSSALARFAAFSRADDVFASWGAYPQALFRAAGGALPRERLDLRDLARVATCRRAGAIEACRAALAGGAPAPMGQGRAGRRLADAVAIARALAAFTPSPRGA